LPFQLFFPLWRKPPSRRRGVLCFLIDTFLSPSFLYVSFSLIH
jgi:hypothetical protein